MTYYHIIYHSNIRAQLCYATVLKLAYIKAAVSSFQYGYFNEVKYSEGHCYIYNGDASTQITNILN